MKRNLVFALVLVVGFVISASAAMAAEKGLEITVREDGKIMWLFDPGTFSKYLAGELEIPAEYLERYGLVSNYASGDQRNLFSARRYNAAQVEDAWIGWEKIKDGEALVEAVRSVSANRTDDHDQIMLEWIVRGFDANNPGTINSGIDVELMPGGRMQLSIGMGGYRFGDTVYHVDTHSIATVEQIVFINNTDTWQTVNFRNFKGWSVGSVLVSGLLDPAWWLQAYIKDAFNAAIHRMEGGNKVEVRQRIYEAYKGENGEILYREHNFALRTISGRNTTDPQCWDMRAFDLKSAATKDQKW